MKPTKSIFIVVSLALLACGGEKSDTPLKTPAAENVSKEKTKLIYINKVTATSFLKDKADFYAYHPWKAFDGDPLTAWNEGVKGPGIGEGLNLEMEVGSGGKPVSFDRIDIMPGFFDERWYKKNNRIKKIGMRAGDFTYEAELDDGMTVKTIFLPRAVTAKELSLVILDTYKGEEYDDTCISEVSIFSAGERYSLFLIDLDKMEDTETHYLAVSEKLKNKHPNIELDSPSGKCFKILAMSITRYDYFFTDGRYVSDDQSSGEFYREYGTWKMNPEKNGIRIQLTKLCRITGIGEPVEVPMYGSGVYYSEYRYDEENENRTIDLEWYGYLVDNFYSELMSSTVRDIRKSDDRVLPGNWKAQAEAEIADRIAAYKDVSEKIKSGYYDKLIEDAIKSKP